MWEEIGLTRAECYIANVVKCRPPQNRDPAPAEIEACRPYLAEQITLIDPAVIVTLGNFATKLLLETTKGIRELRGQVFERERAAWSRRTTPPTSCGPAARPWPRCGPTSSGPSASWWRAARERGRWSGPAGRRAPPGSWPGGSPRCAGPATSSSWSGDLGAGKTVFAQGFAAALGVAGPVTSPTFALVRQYRCGDESPVGTLIHADVYRTGSVDEVVDLALAELVEEDAVALVEWGELAAPALGDSALEVTLVAPDPVGAPDRRVATLRGPGPWADRVGVAAALLERPRRGRRERRPHGYRRRPWWPSRRRPRRSGSPCARRRACRPS